MTIFRSKLALKTEIPSNLSVPQFFLDAPDFPTRPTRLSSTPCLIDDTTGRLVFLDELRLRTRELAASLYHTYRIGCSDVVGIMSPNHIDFGPVVWATHRVGGVVSTLSPALTHVELAHSLKITKPRVLIFHSKCLTTIQKTLSGFESHSIEHLIMMDSPGTGGYRGLSEVVEEGTQLPPHKEHIFARNEGEEAIAFLAPSSGTTGLQKAVCITHRNVISMVLQEAAFNGVNDTQVSWEERRFRPGDVAGGFLPVYHIYGLVFNLHAMLYFGMTLVLAPEFHFESFLGSIQRFQITHLALVPPQAVLICKHPSTKNYDLSSVRYCLVAAAPLSANLTAELLALLPDVSLGQGYGLTESCGAVSMFPLSQKVGTLGSAGQLLPKTEAKIITTDGRLALSGEDGELYVRGPQITPGYYGNLKATREAIYDDGWLRTGDQAMFKEDDLYIVDRVKELIKVKGHQVAPAEVEGCILTHTCVADVAVIGVVDDFCGEKPLAFVVLKPTAAQSCRDDVSFEPLLKADIQNQVKKSLSRHKWLGGVRFVEIIPRNGSGKILRRELRQQEELPMQARSKM